MNKTLFWGGVLLVGYWWMKNGSQNLGPATNSLGFGDSPNSDNLNQQESANWWSKYLQATPPQTVVQPYVHIPMSDTPQQIRDRILHGSGL